MAHSPLPSRPDGLLGWRHFEHVADVGIVGFGPAPRWAVQEAARAMTAVITEAPIELGDYAVIRCRAETLDDLFVAWLNALAYEMAVRGMIFGDFVVRIADGHLCAAAYGELIDARRHQPACEVKGATYTELGVEPDDVGLWSARCVIDV